MNTVLKNLLALTSEGAFSHTGTIIPMSAFKWHILYKVALIEDVAPYIDIALSRHKGDKRTNIPEDTWKKIKEAHFDNTDEITDSFDITDIESQRLSYVLKRYILKDIVYKERHSIDTSKTSLDLLSLILQNTDCILRYGVRLRGIIMLGQFLRNKGQNVDFVKLELWLKRLKLQRMAKLQASFLICLCGFELDEFPYIKKYDKHAKKLALTSLERMYQNNKYERTPGKYSISNCIKFRHYSRSESFCKAVSTLIRGITEIEE